MKRMVLFGISGFFLAWLLFGLFWGEILGGSAIPEHLSDWVIFLCALLIPAAYAAFHEYDFGYSFGSTLKYVALFLLVCVSANMIGFALGSIVAFFEAIGNNDFEMVTSLAGIFLAIVYLGTPGTTIIVYVWDK